MVLCVSLVSSKSEHSVVQHKFFICLELAYVKLVRYLLFVCLFVLVYFVCVCFLSLSAMYRCWFLVVSEHNNSPAQIPQSTSTTSLLTF